MYVRTLLLNHLSAIYVRFSRPSSLYGWKWPTVKSMTVIHHDAREPFTACIIINDRSVVTGTN
jgi:hypothetical protein